MGIQDSVPLGRSKRAIVSLVINFIALAIFTGGFFTIQNDYSFFMILAIALVFGLIAFAAGLSLRDLPEKRALEKAALSASYLMGGLLLLPILYLAVLFFVALCYSFR